MLNHSYFQTIQGKHFEIDCCGNKLKRSNLLCSFLLLLGMDYPMSVHNRDELGVEHLLSWSQLH